MINQIKRWAGAVCICISIAGCQAIRFEQSLYGIAMKNMMEVCIAKYQAGELPGLSNDEHQSLAFSTDAIDFSARNKISYPLQINCIVAKDEQKYTFPFKKASEQSDWKLIR